MVKNLLIILISFLQLSLFSQNNDIKNVNKPYSIDLEINLGINRFLIEGNGIQSKYGCGLSIYRVWFNDKWYNIISGIIINELRFFDDYIQESHFSHYENMRYNIVSFSVPVFFRANIGDQYKFFIETGPSLEPVLLELSKGEYYSYPPYKNSYFNADSDILFKYPDIGANIGTGIKLSFDNIELIFSGTYHMRAACLFKKNTIYTNNEYLILKTGININIKR